jgi:hypothetical protein
MYRAIARGLTRAALLLLICCGVAVHAAEDTYPSSGGQKFSIAVIPDTQYLFDEDRYDPEVLAKTFQWIVDHTREKNIVFTDQLGDIVNNGLPTEFAKASDVFKILDNNDIQYGYSAGNHDINGGFVRQRAWPFAVSRLFRAQAHRPAAHLLWGHSRRL